MEIFLDKSLPFVVKQSGGGILKFYGPDAGARKFIAKEQERQSWRNCRKSRLGGGFNPLLKEEEDEYFKKLAKELGL